MDKKEYSVEIGGQTITAQFSDLAERANGSVILRCGDTVVLATAVMSSGKKEGLNWFPLTVDYEEKFYAAGYILGSRFLKRESRPSDAAVLSGRIIDRTIRPLFNQQIRNEMQVVTTVLSIGEYAPDVLAVNAASLALATSDIPWGGPVSAARIGKNRDDDALIINPTYDEREHKTTKFEIIACGNNGHINMIETTANEASEEVIANALKKASEEIEKFQTFQKMIIAEIGKEKIKIETEKISEEAKKLFEQEISGKVEQAVFNGPGNTAIDALKDEWLAICKEKLPEESVSLSGDYYEEIVNDILHSAAIEKDKRADGRPMDTVRELYAQAGGLSGVVHGAGLFYRGGTHILSVLTLGGPDDSQIINEMETRDAKKHYMHHYNFAPFSVGEVGRMGMNRRMVGHGALAEKALLPVIPSKQDFPYTIRIVSESMASNGSTSMASVCGSTLALMDGGVPIKRPVAGIAMGLMMEDEENYKILTDIQGPEDYHGDMDFKVAGTREGITAIQMDIKVGGIPIKILSEALVAAKTARLHILDTIEKEISAPRADLAPKAPRILTIQIKPDEIGMLIGPGGKMIKKIQEETGADISIEEDGTVYITGEKSGAEKARAFIETLTHEYIAGEKFEGEVTKLFDFGALVKIGPNTEGLVHISEIAPFRIEKIESVLSLGEIVPVIVKEVDKKADKISLSIKAIDPDFAKKKGVQPSTSPSSYANRPPNGNRGPRPYNKFGKR